MAVAPGRVTVTFELNHAFKAMVACNKADGIYSFTGSELSFTGWQVTERGCLPPLENEQLIVDALHGGYSAVTVSSSELQLSGRHTIVFRRI